MITILTKTHLFAYPSTDHQITRPTYCLCSCCDIACECPPGTDCDHHATGEGGLCLACQIATTPDGLGIWRRVQHFPEVIAYVGCLCPEASPEGCCEETAPLYRQHQKNTPRPAGSQRQTLLQQLKKDHR